MSRGPIAAAWEEYRTTVVPASASSVQVEETRRGFYAGAASVFGSLTRQLSTSDETTEGDVALLDTIARELSGFLADFLAEVPS